MNPQPSKRFRWVGQPSEEELLGIPVSTRHHRGPVRAAQPPPARRVVVAPPPARRRRAADFLTVLGTALVIWLVLGGAGASFQSSGATPVAPKATDPAPELVHVDRAEPGPLPRTILPPPQEEAGEPRPGRRAESPGPKSGRQDDPVPSPGGAGGGAETPAERPSVEATLPVVGTVTVEEPELPPLEAPEPPPVPELRLP